MANATAWAQEMRDVNTVVKPTYRAPNVRNEDRNSNALSAMDASMSARSSDEV